MYLREPSVQNISHSLKEWHIKLATSPCHSTLTPGKPVPPLIPNCPVPGTNAIGKPIFFQVSDKICQGVKPKHPALRAYAWTICARSRHLEQKTIQVISGMNRCLRSVRQYYLFFQLSQVLTDTCDGHSCIIHIHSIAVA